MSRQLLDHRAWDAASSDERDATARDVARSVSQGFAYEGLRTCRMGGIAREVAWLARGDVPFVLVPGGEVDLGFASDEWEPTTDEAADWSELVEDFGLSGTLSQYIDESTTEVRTVSVPPLLVEVVAIPPNEDRPLAAILGEWAREGFRLPESEEWEWLCGAGARTLYRWGDHTPSRSSPWSLRQASVENPSAAPPIHRRPNAFGIRIAEDTYRNEAVARGEASRAGDGGGSECGGASAVASWLVLATAAKPQPRDPKGPGDLEHEIVRRVLPLA